MQSLIGKFFKPKEESSTTLHSYLFQKDSHDRLIAAQKDEQKLIAEIVEENSGRNAQLEQRQEEERIAREQDRKARLKRHTSKTQACLIVDGLYLGGRLCAMNYENLEQQSISVVLNITADVKNYHEADDLGLKYHRFAVEDSKRCDLKVHFRATADIIEGCIARGSRVLVHCREGLSRSPSIIISYLMLKARMDLEEAMELVREQNGMIRINEGFLRQLAELHVELQREKGVENPVMTLFDKEGRVERTEGEYDTRTAEEKKKHAQKEARKKRKPRQTLHQFMKAKSEEIREAKRLKQDEEPEHQAPSRQPTEPIPLGVTPAAAQ